MPAYLLGYLIVAGFFLFFVGLFWFNRKGLRRELMYGRVLLSPEEVSRNEVNKKSISPDKTAAFIFAYCLFKDGKRLTKMAKKSTELGIEALCNGEASDIILSTAYSCWREEARLKREMVVDEGIGLNKIHFIEGSRHTFDEIKDLKNVIKSICAEKLIVIVEKYHAPRVKVMLEEKFPEIQFDFRVFQTKYERTLEPCKNHIVRFLKEHRGSLPTWWLWNTCCNMIWS